MAVRMHADEVEVRVALVQRLLADQSPHLVVRLPRIAWAVEQVTLRS